MESILGWIKGIVILFVVLSALMYLVPQKQYKKYIQFFIEMLIVVAIITPVSKVIYANEDFEEMIKYSQFWQELENMQKDTDKMEFLQSDYYKQEYEQAIGEDIAQMAEDKEFECEEVQVALSDNYEIEAVSMQVSKSGESDDAAVEKIVIAGSQSSDELQGSITNELREKIKDFYQLEDSQITITYVGE